jgi:hypothetical protein
VATLKLGRAAISGREGGTSAPLHIESVLGGGRGKSEGGWGGSGAAGHGGGRGLEVEDDGR